ncbi:MAG: cysteine--tRNA ligase [Eubacterium sp.]|nr:cysteine--tRNA ligase [Eubacterium sp.]
MLDVKINLYNTLGKNVQEFVPNEAGKVGMYTCGPTVYHYAHIGNLRTYIMEDVLEKTLRFVGYDVKRVMNITDVGHLSSDGDTGEDKMLAGAKREHKTVMEIAQYYTDCFKNDACALNIRWPEYVEPATNCIADFIEMIEVLLKKDFAYVAGDNVYFDTSKLKDYYVLSAQNEEELVVGARDDVEEDTNKRNKADFVLWFTKSKFENQELKWESPWGLGYPGWHIECSCISKKHLGEYLDIHCGGVDNIFPHHTNEIAQSESYFGHKWCNYWFHVNHLNTSSGKMAKSAGGFLTVQSLVEKGYDPMVYRLFCLQSHYRKPLEFSFEALDNVAAAYDKLIARLKRLVSTDDTKKFAENALSEIMSFCDSDSDRGTQSIDSSKVCGRGPCHSQSGVVPDGVDATTYSEYEMKFAEALANDINTSSALTILYDALKADTDDKTKIALVLRFDQVLSIGLSSAFDPSACGDESGNDVDEELSAFVEQKIAERADAKKNKDFTTADAIRDELLEKGIVLKDTREGTTWERV